MEDIYSELVEEYGPVVDFEEFVAGLAVGINAEDIFKLSAGNEALAGLLERLF